MSDIFGPRQDHDPDAADLQIGEVADLFGISTKTLRHYEKIALLVPHRQANGYRVYTPQDVHRLQRIRLLQALGLPLKTIKRILDEQDEQLWSAVLAALREDIDTEIAQLEARKARLDDLLEAGTPEAIDLIDAANQQEANTLRDGLPDLSRVAEYLGTHLPHARAALQADHIAYSMLGALQRPNTPDVPLYQRLARELLVYKLPGTALQQEQWLWMLALRLGLLPHRMIARQQAAIRSPMAAGIGGARWEGPTAGQWN